MKRTLFLIVVLFLTALANSNCAGRSSVRTRPGGPPPRVVVDVSFFYDELDPYGRWFSLEGYGWVWTPYDVQVGWRPYTYGYWVFTDYGWTWVSKWRWGWAPFHYGRWLFHRNHGWVWRPGREWAPAWVVWRQSPGWIGWAPMPPQVDWQGGSGLRARWDEIDRIVEPHWYSFVEERRFTAGDLDKRLELSARNVTLFGETRNVTNYASVENRVVNRSINVERIEQAEGRSVLRRRVVDSGSPNRGGEVRGNDAAFYRPTIERETTDRTPRRIETPSRPPDSSAEQIRRRNESEQRRLETQQAREREALENRQRIERTQPPRQTQAEEISRQHENQRRALEEQMRREQQILKSRQEQQRKVEPARPAPTRKEQERRPTPERKPAPDRKPL
jgi:hypothetical protein